MGIFNSFSAAASDVFAGEADKSKASASLEQAAAAEEQAKAAGTTAQADLLQGEGDTLEGAAYGSAASLATLNAEYTTASTNIQLAQQQRQQSMVIGKQKSEFAGAGLQTVRLGDRHHGEQRRPGRARHATSRRRKG